MNSFRMVFMHVLKQGSGHNARLRCILFCIYTCSFVLIYTVLCLLYALVLYSEGVYVFRLSKCDKTKTQVFEEDKTHVSTP